MVLIAVAGASRAVTAPPLLCMTSSGPASLEARRVSSSAVR